MKRAAAAIKACLAGVCLAGSALMLCSCAALMSVLTDPYGVGTTIGTGVGNIPLPVPVPVGPVTSGTVGQFHVQLVECAGNASSQSVTAIVTVTNNGPNDRRWIGGSLDGTFAVDVNGITSKPYNSAGINYQLPSGVMVRAEIPRIEPVAPGTPMFQTLRVSFGGGSDKFVDFRNVPVVWTN